MPTMYSICLLSNDCMLMRELNEHNWRRNFIQLQC